MQINLISNSTINVNKKVVSLGDIAIKQGKTFTLTVYYKGDRSAWGIRGQIRDNYAEVEGVILANFTFLPLEYDAVEDSTRITLVLKGSVTELLPSTRYQAQEGQTPSVTNCYVYDVEIIDPLDVTNVIDVIEASFVQVKPEVTRL